MTREEGPRWGRQYDSEQDLNNDLDKFNPIQLKQIQLASKQFENVLVKHAVLRSKVILQFFPKRLDKQVELRKILNERLHNRLYPADVQYVAEVQSHCVVFNGKIPDPVVDWIFDRFHDINKDLGKL